MDRALYVAMTGAQHLLQAQTANSHNLANASTTGFKAELQAQYASAIEGGILPTRINSVLGDRGWDATPGGLQTTGRPLDIAMRGDNWLAVQGQDGREAYTRSGSLRVSPEGMLTTVSGELVLGDGGPMSLPLDHNIQIGDDGTVSALPGGEAAGSLIVLGRLRVVEAQPEQLERRADGLMRARAELPEASGAVMTSGALESSNVNVAEAMVNMIELSRQFELQVKAMKAAEDNERQAATISRMS